MGFLHAQPENWETSRWQKHLEATGENPVLPVPQEGAYLFEMFLDIGAVSDTGAGPRPLLWSELAGFSTFGGALAYWEAKLLREMSLAYVSGLSLGRDPLSKPPWDEATLVVAHRMRKRK